MRKESVFDFAGYVNGLTKGLENWDYYGARIRQAVKRFECGYTGKVEAMKELCDILMDIETEKRYLCL